ncbi:MAG: hypothetical protein R2932_21100 [Caldilineaceae bacterium]
MRCEYGNARMITDLHRNWRRYSPGADQLPDEFLADIADLYGRRPTALLTSTISRKSNARLRKLNAFYAQYAEPARAGTQVTQVTAPQSV